MGEDIPDVYLRFEGFEGECRDEKHPAKDGWITIKSFTFGFGFSGSDGESEEATEETGSKPAKAGAAGAATKPKPKKKGAGMKSGPLNFDCISFTKASDAMSHKLMEACHKGTKIPQVDLHACRYGGGPEAVKIAFLRLSFFEVHLKTCRLNLTTDNLPSEDVEFEYSRVEMHCLWTDNETGQPLDAEPDMVSWDLTSVQGEGQAPDDGV